MSSARPRVLITRAVFPEVVDELREHFDVQPNPGDVPFTPGQLAGALRGVDGVLSSLGDRIDARLLAAAPRLRAVCNIAVGYNNIDVAACTERGIQVTNTPGVLDAATADFTWALLLAAARRVGEAERWLRAGQWKGWKLDQWLGCDVQGATLGILGMGRIGAAVARRARGFEMRVLYHNRKPAPAALERELGATRVSLGELLERADFLAVHLPYSDETHHFLGAAELARMKSSAVLVQVSRGGVIDDRALARALAERRIAAAGLDVYEGEPALLPALLELENAVLAPHIGSSTHSTRLAMARMAARNLIEILIRGTALHPVNRL